ncbi:MarR family winged helix-turn-helix transcriptional regulator [Intrasporangium flavum]|uniref:MarR family winged helix-turn-helix transcriptional regulator n=1 Tax=Intrasporangium flavum TaxID=1428657 RepID=UPI00096C2816|nr:MarR family transcriptional regulator [Intrasporangium flavum]
MTSHLELFDDLVRVETYLWNDLDRALKIGDHPSLAWLTPLRVLQKAPGSRVHDLAADIGISPGGASKLVDRLVAAGLVSREADEEDRRASRLRLTPEGRRATRAGAAAAARWLADRFDTALGAGPTQDLASLLGRLRAQGSTEEGAA